MIVNRKYKLYHNILRRAISYLNDAIGFNSTSYRNTRIERAKEEIDIAIKQLTKLL